MASEPVAVAVTARAQRAAAMSGQSLEAGQVAACLLDRATRLSTLEALECHAVPIPTAVSLAAAPVLHRLLTMDASDVDRTTFGRAGLLLGRLIEEAPEPAPVFGSAFRDHGIERLWNADSVLNAALRKPAPELSEADARSYACALAYFPPTVVRDWTAPFGAAGFTAHEWLRCGHCILPAATQIRCNQCNLLLHDRTKHIVRLT